MNLKEQVTPHKLSLLLLIKEYCSIRKRIRYPDLGPQGPIFGVKFGTAESPSPLEPAAPVMVEKCEPQHDAENVMETNTQAPETDVEKLSLTEAEMTRFMVAILKLIQSSDLEPGELLTRIEEFCTSGLSQLYLEKLTQIHEGGLQSLMNFFQQITSDFFTEPYPLVQKTSVIGLFIRRLSLCFEALSFSQVTNFYAAFAAYFNGLKNAKDKLDAVALEETMAENSMDCTGDITIPEPSASTTNTHVAHYSQRQAEFFILQQSNLLQYNQGKALPPGQLEKKIKELLSANPGLADAHYLSYLNHLRVVEYCGALHSLYHYFDRNQFKRREEKDDEGFKGYRYAILNLATLHFRFGHREEALIALKEAMSVAQEYNDNICLQHALSWFHRLGEEMPQTSRNLDKSANDVHLAYLTSLNVQVMAKRIALEGLTPANVFDHIIKSDWVNCQQNLTDLSEISLAQKSALWTMYGNRNLPTLFCQMALNLYGSEHGVQISGEATTIAKCTVARALADIGRFPASLAILNSCAQLCENSSHRSVWQLTELLIKFDQYLHEAKFTNLDEIVQKIKCLDPLEGQIREATHLKEIGDTEKSYEIISNMKHADLSTHPGLKCRVTLAYTELCCQIGNPIGAMDSLLACIVFCKEKHLLYYEAVTAMHLAYVQFCLNLPEQALNLIERNLVPILDLGSNYDKARCLYLYAKCRVSASKDEAKRREVLLNVTELLCKSVALFQTLGNSRRVKDVFYYQARLHHELGLISERNKFAIDFRKLDSMYPTLTQMTVNTL